MASEHSKLWKSRRSLLGKKETQLQSELESVSSSFEGKAKNVLIGVAIVGVAAFTIGMAINASRKNKKPSKARKKETQPKEKVVTKSSGFKNILLEKIIATVLGILLSRLTDTLKSSNTKKEQD